MRAADLRAQINGITQEQLNPLLNQRNEMITAAFQAQAGLPQFANVDEQRRQQMAVAAVDSSSTGQALKAQIEAVRGALSPLNDQLRDLETVGAQGARILQDINAPLSELQQMQGLQNLTTADLRKRQLDAMQTVTAYGQAVARADQQISCLLYTSPSPRD